MVKKYDMIKVLVREIIDIEQEITFMSQDNMRKAERIILPNEGELSKLEKNEETIIQIKDTLKGIKRLRNNVNAFYEMFKIIDKISEEEE